MLKFFVAGVTFYGMATFEGPLLSIRSVNALSHYTDWTIGHVHGGALGWNGFMAAGMFYWLAPRLWNTPAALDRARRTCTSGSGPSASCSTSPSMWVSGITQGLMLGATKDGGTVLAYPNFIETRDLHQALMHDPRARRR